MWGGSFGTFAAPPPTALPKSAPDFLLATAADYVQVFSMIGITVTIDKSAAYTDLIYKTVESLPMQSAHDEID